MIRRLRLKFVLMNGYEMKEQHQYLLGLVSFQHDRLHFH